MDNHVHIIGMGNSDSGIEIQDELSSLFHPVKYTRFKYFLKAAEISDPATADQQYFQYLKSCRNAVPLPFQLAGLALDRTGVAVVGAIVLVVGGVLTPSQAWATVDVGTIALLFGLMLVSAQLRLGGFYTAVTRRLGGEGLGALGLLALLVAAAGLLSALLSNDIVCLAMAPVVLEVTHRRGLEPVPYLLALAFAANTGSAATLIGNPQNILIGERMHLTFARYLLDGGVPALLGLILVWGAVALAWRGRLLRDPSTWKPLTGPLPEFNRWHTIKGVLVLVVVVVLFLLGRPERAAIAKAQNHPIAMPPGASSFTSKRASSRPPHLGGTFEATQSSTG